MEIRSPLKNGFTLTRYRPHEKFLARAFDLSEGLQGVSKKIRIKDFLQSARRSFQFGEGGTDGFQPFAQAKVNVPSCPFFGELKWKPKFDPHDLFERGKQWNIRPLN